MATGRLRRHSGKPVAERLSARPSSGHAWAARRELLADCGLYDACVCGVGDMATALAALGRPEAFVEGYPLNDAQKKHYLSWAERFGTAVSGQVSCLPATIFHLFHGRLVDWAVSHTSQPAGEFWV